MGTKWAVDLVGMKMEGKEIRKIGTHQSICLSSTTHKCTEVRNVSEGDNRRLKSL